MIVKPKPTQQQIKIARETPYTLDTVQVTFVLLEERGEKLEVIEKYIHDCARLGLDPMLLAVEIIHEQKRKSREVLHKLLDE